MKKNVQLNSLTKRTNVTFQLRPYAYKKHIGKKKQDKKKPKFTCMIFNKLKLKKKNWDIYILCLVCQKCVQEDRKYITNKDHTSHNISSPFSSFNLLR